jgi:histidinol-phosphatase (PHP family)
MTGQNLHTHTLYSDGKASLLQTVEKAVAMGMHTLGISDHSPLPFENSFAIKEHDVEQYCAEVRKLQQHYADVIKLFLSLEIDYIPGMSAGFASWKKNYDLDYVIGSIHLVGAGSRENLWFTDGPLRETYDEGLMHFYGGDIRKAVRAFYEQTNLMITDESFDVIGHFDKIKMHNQNRYFTEDELWYRQLVRETIDLIASRHLIVELNTRGVYKGRSDSFFPSDWILRELHERGVPVIISSDAHHPDELNMLFAEAATALKATGYKETLRFTGKGWKEVALE